MNAPVSRQDAHSACVSAATILPDAVKWQVIYQSLRLKSKTYGRGGRRQSNGRACSLLSWPTGGREKRSVSSGLLGEWLDLGNSTRDQ